MIFENVKIQVWNLGIKEGNNKSQLQAIVIMDSSNKSMTEYLWQREVFQSW
ncbi:MAG: hypothetical protein F6K48_17235 [Okeania sp. SIO3H1]|uniref:hypothetical protein n=1 Tax=Okeania sp. SIO1I7 TaxID=2607772 RepID=UPI0013CB14A3|nr:hypothetical protein [Okeania sp. SIO1I7]NEN90552.1 hypothetical protein [Okeania sp. SIO3H1]NET28604.1 hypothetical protein [Okeania sp. SIO1I7]